MNFQDRSIRCSDCGTSFTVSAEKQEFCQSWGINSEPRRCPSCNRARKTERYRTGSFLSNAPSQMFRATCAECGKNTEVPFEPRAGKRVYCSYCYRKVKLYR